MPVIQFKGRNAIETYHHTVPHHAFEFDRELSILAEGEEASLEGNLIIEGENLKALKALLPTHVGRIKCIYMDPPYNTGNEGWVYNDNVSSPQFKEWIGHTVGNEAEDACRHDKWCCMMWPRLQVLRELLLEDGVIFISIDDNEVQHLRMMMNEIFGSQNFIASVIWQKMDSPKNTAIHLSEDHEYVLVYAKNSAVWRPNKLERSEEMIARYKNPDDDSRGPWLLSDLAARNCYSRGRYSIETPSGRIIAGPPAGSYWRVSRQKFDELEQDGRIWWGKSGDNRPGIKRFLSEVQNGVVPRTLWLWKEVGSTRNAKQELSQLMAAGTSQDLFVTPKPVRLIQQVLLLSTNSNDGDIILDCTAGSGTTGHAVAQLNNEDGGDRRFILVQMPHDSKSDQVAETNICRDITRERVRRVIEGENVPATGGSFTYARLSQRPLLGDRSMAEQPDYRDLARYVFYTETSRALDESVWALESRDESGFIGEHGGEAFYLLYEPGEEKEGSLDAFWLDETAQQDPRFKLVVYCERIAIHPDELLRWGRFSGKAVRAMWLPGGLR